MRLSILSLLLVLFFSTVATAQTTVRPGELYSSENVLTVRTPNGIREITARTTRNVRVISGTGTLAGCPTTSEVRVWVETVDRDADLVLTVIDCRGRSTRLTVSMRTPYWDLANVNLGTVEAGSTRCADFQIKAGESEYVDSITVADPRVKIRLPGRMPTRLRANELYMYVVCFAADQPGVYKFPVVTWMRRAQPAGGFTTYPVSDTGIVRVVPPRNPPPVTTPVDTIRSTPRRDPIPRAPIERRPEIRREPPVDEPVTDPTTFRSVAVPNAIIPDAGTAFIGSYDFLGLVAGYVPVDNVMILAGGALPTPDDWTGVRGDMFGAYSIGLKVGYPLTSRLHVAAGYQWGRSIFDQAVTVDTLESQITIQAPYGAVSYGDDDNRISVTFGYAMKHHVIPTGEFDVNAALVALGGDRRLSNHWKIAGEVAYMETLGVIPIVASARYFTNDYALDLGLAFVGITVDGGTAPKIPLLPVISGVFVF